MNCLKEFKIKDTYIIRVGGLVGLILSIETFLVKLYFLSLELTLVIASA